MKKILISIEDRGIEIAFQRLGQHNGLNIDIPEDILEKVDREAERVGVPRTSLLKVWIAQHADRLAS